MRQARAPIRRHACFFRERPRQGSAPDQTGSYEKKPLENVERLNRKIAELQSKQRNALELNERAEKPKK
jgi:hypothetical protein